MPSRPEPTGRSSSRSSRTSDAAAADPTAVEVARVTGAHALRGLLRIRAHDPDAPALQPGTRILMEHGGVWSHAEVTSLAAHGAGLLLGLAGVDDRTAAEALRGARLLVPRDQLPPPAEDEFYHFEVEGFAVETVDGTAVGTIAETMDNGLHDVWTVRDGEREHLIPVVADVVRTIDRAGRRVVIEPLPGLLD